MKILKLIALFALTLTFSQCKTTSPTEPTAGGNSVIQVTHILDTVRGKFYDLAQANLSATPQEVLIMTADWVKTQPNVASATWFDSTYLFITMKSGLQTSFAINIYGSDSLSLTRGGGNHAGGGKLTPSAKANHTITNKSVLIYSPFVQDERHLYDKGEILPLVNKIRNSGKGVSLTLLEDRDCKVQTIETFGNYGLVIIDTHGQPDGFWTGQVIYTPTLQYDTTDAIIMENMNNAIPDGYNKILKGYFRFGYNETVSANPTNWQEFLTKQSRPDGYRIFATSSYINSLPAMPNTIIVGNMCYSGWNAAGKARYGYIVKDPIKQAFTNRNLISYYSYGNIDGTSLPVDNAFAKRMEDSLLTSLIIDGDSTGNAYLNSSDQQFTAGDFIGPHESPTLPFIHSGADDYSFDDCVNVFTDARDGNIYKATCIGKQVWMAENLRYNAPGSDCAPTTDCSKYGRLYTWATMMNGQAASSANPSGVQGICPKGWHLPSTAEWDQLINATGGSAVSGGNLKTLTGWEAPNKGATDKYGFHALPAGIYFADSNAYWFQGSTAEWRSTSINPLEPRLFGIANISWDSPGFSSFVPSVGKYVTDESRNKFPCRCLKD